MEREDILIPVASDIVSELEDIAGSGKDIRNVVESILIEYIVNKGGNLDAYRNLLLEIRKELSDLKEDLS